MGKRLLLPVLSYPSFKSFWFFAEVDELADNADVGGLGPFLTFGHFEGDSLPLFQSSESIAVDGRKVYENITLAIFTLNESVTFFCAEPLHDPFLQRKTSSNPRCDPVCTYFITSIV